MLSFCSTATEHSSSRLLTIISILRRRRIYLDLNKIITTTMCMLIKSPNTIDKQTTFYSGNKRPLPSSEPTRKKVSFAETCRARNILHLDSYTDAEISSTWYSIEEYAEQRRKCRNIILKIIDGKPHKYCARGLERMTPEAIEQRESIRLDAYIAVFKEQKKQSLMQINDPEAIANEYRKISAMKHQQVASEIGRRDELIALKITGRSTHR